MSKKRNPLLDDVARRRGEEVPTLSLAEDPMAAKIGKLANDCYQLLNATNNLANYEVGAEAEGILKQAADQLNKVRQMLKKAYDAANQQT